MIDHDAIAAKAPRTVPGGQTPLDDKLNNRLLDVIREGEAARDAGTGSPYHGHSLEHCLHATGWVSRDLCLALNESHARAEAAEAERVAEWNRRRKAEASRDLEKAVCATIKAELDALRVALVDHNDLLRSASQIARREGIDGEIASTNWDAYYNRVAMVLKRHHEIANTARQALKGQTNDSTCAQILHL